MADSSWEVLSLDARQSTPDWFQQGQVHAQARFIASADEAESLVSDSPSLLSRVDFETDRLLYLASVGPDATCRQIEIDDLSVADEEISVTAHVVRDSGMAAQVITYPASLLWIPDTSTDSATVSITDGWEQTHAVDTSV